VRSFVALGFCSALAMFFASTNKQISLFTPLCHYRFVFTMFGWPRGACFWPGGWWEAALRTVAAFLCLALNLYLVEKAKATKTHTHVRCHLGASFLQGG